MANSVDNNGHYEPMHLDQQKLQRLEIWLIVSLNPIALRKAKIVYDFGFSESNRVKGLKQIHIIYSF